MGLEGGLAVLIVAKIKEELVDRLSELPVLLVGIELLADELELVRNAVGVAAVTTAQELVTLVVDLVPLLGGTILQDVTLLLQALADVLVEVPEPALELGILIGILVDLVDRIDKVVGGGAVGEALEECLDVGQPMLVFCCKT